MMQTVLIPMEELVQLLEVQLVHSGTAQLNVTGMSMWPMLFNRRDFVTLVPVPERLQKGDLILYRRDNGQYVLHRIVRIVSADEFICSGDNQWVPETVYARQVFALVTAFRRGGKDYPVTHPGYQRYVRFWVAMFPVRRPVLSLKNLLVRLRRKMKTL